jgi:predicted DNA-binding protein
MKDSRITFRLTEEEKEKLYELAAKRDITLSQLIRELCEEIFNKEEK